MKNQMYQSIQNLLMAGQGIGLKTEGNTGGGKLEQDFRQSLVPLDMDHLDPVYLEEADQFTLIEPITPAERLIVLGGGHVSLSLCQFAAACGFSVTVVDDRPDFANEKRFPMADQIICKPFVEALEEMNITPYDYVVIVTRGHTHDGDCLRTLAKKPRTAYLGQIGSRKRVARLKDTLQAEGLNREWLDSISSPIGLDIGAVTPAEISIAIMAEIITYKRIPGNSYHAINTSDLEPELIEALAKQEGPHALATILTSRGSTPRAAGSKMIVSPKGEIQGTVGGGYAEAVIIREAVSMIGTGNYRLIRIDMSGKIAAEEGMVCGGEMTVLIEGR